MKKDEPVPILKAAIRLLRHIFSSALDVAEFQRLLCTPNVPKASAALISIAEKHREQELKVRIIIADILSFLLDRRA